MSAWEPDTSTMKGCAQDIRNTAENDLRQTLDAASGTQTLLGAAKNAMYIGAIGVRVLGSIAVSLGAIADALSDRRCDP